MTTDPPDTQQHTCLDPAETGALTVADARRQILSLIQPLPDREQVSLKEGLDRVLGEDLHAPFNIPPWDNSAMDGYAVRSADLPTSGRRQLTLIGTAMAGSPFHGHVAPGQCVRIMTGGVIPRGCDTVIMQEQVTRENDMVTVNEGHEAGRHVRRAGEDIAEGQRVFNAGRRLSAADIGLLASLGIERVSVRRRPRVAFFSTGDELRALGDTLDEGAIYDSNRYVLYGVLRRIGVELVEMDIVRDKREALHTALMQASSQADLVITSGGASVGDADFVRDGLASLGELQFWKVGVKPGRPLAFGRIGDAWFFGLPGNPVSTMVTYYQFVQPALRRLEGEDAPPPLQFKVTCVTALQKAPGRMEFQRGILEFNAAGETVVRTTGGQNSNLLSSMSKANCFIVLPAEWGDVPAGSLVEVQPFVGL
ncbi:MAG: molybdopterin molybdotransferase MoeA [Gammaproteobacteria bacterium]